MKKFSGYFLLLLFAAVFLVSCSKSKDLWKGKVETENGVTIVRNPKEPMYAEVILSLEEDLNIGTSSGPEEYMFSDIIDLEVDQEERIYVLDSKESRVKVYDRDGNHLITFGKPGKGPGELYIPRGISIFDNQVMVVEINRRLSFFSLEGEFIQSMSTKEYWVLGAQCDSKGNIVVVTGRLDPENPTYQYLKFDKNMNLLFRIAESPAPDISKGFNPFMPISYLKINKDDNFVYGYPEDYTIQILNPEGKLLKKITREYVPVEVTEEEKEEYKKDTPPGTRFNFSKHHSAFRSFFLDDQGRIFVQTWEKTGTDGDYIYDVFDPEGKFLTRISLTGRPVMCKRGKLYVVDEDEEGFPLVKRYKVTWKELQI